jgi:hypothetical protein
VFLDKDRTMDNVQKHNKQKQTPWLLVRKRTIPTEQPPLVGEVNANLCE